MNLADQISLKAIKANGALSVPTQLSRQTAHELLAESWIYWQERGDSSHGIKGVVALSASGREALASERRGAVG